MAFIRDYDGGYYGVRWVWDVPGDDYFDAPDIDTDTSSIPYGTPSTAYTTLRYRLC